MTRVATDGTIGEGLAGPALRRSPAGSSPSFGGGRSSPARRVASKRAPERLRLLCIEDSEFDFQMIGHLLRNSGFALESLRVEDEAGMRAALARGPWDVILSDHHLPNFSATRALDVFKETSSDAPFLIVSGSIGEDLAVDAMLRGADDYVLKSNLVRLLPAIRRSLDAARMRRDALVSERARCAIEARLHSITSNFPGMAFSLVVLPDGSGRFEYVSEGARRLFGIDPADIMRDPKVFFGLLDPEGNRRIGGGAHEAEVGEELRVQVRYRRADERTANRWFELAGTLLRSDNGARTWEGVVLDISREKAAGAALESSREELRQLSLHLQAVREDERKALARELHDDVGGLLAGIRLELGALQSRLVSTDPALKSRIASVDVLLESARAASDRIMRNLRPSVIDLGLVEALRWLVRDFGKRYGIEAKFRSNVENPKLLEQPRVALFRVGQEALLNVVKHARAKTVRVDLFVDDKQATLEIVDDGFGISTDRSAALDRFGIRGMRERIEGLGGWMEVSGGSAGTSLMAAVPLTEERPT